MDSNDVNRTDPVSKEIRRQFGSPGMRRYLASLPAFSVDTALPERLRVLLSNLQGAEARRRGSGKGRN
jgi:hypothetical protein